MPATTPVPRLTRLFAFLFVLLLALALGTAALAQAPDIADKQQAVIDNIAKQAKELDRQIAAGENDDAELVDIRTKLDELSHGLLESGLAFRPRLREINTRLEQLGPPPAEGQPAEPEAVAAERRELNTEKAEINALIGRAEDLSLHVNQQMTQISEMRRTLFTRTLSRRSDVNLALFGEAAGEFGTMLRRLGVTVGGWWHYVLLFKLGAAIAATLLALLLAAVLFFGGKRLFGSMIEPNPQLEEPSYLTRLSVAFWSTMLPTLSLGVFFAVTFFLYSSYGVLRDDIGRILAAAFGVTGLIFFVGRLAYCALMPSLPGWRLMAIDNRAAHTLFWLITATVTINGLDYIIGTISDLQGAALSLAVAKSLIATVLVGVLVILIAGLRPFTRGEGEAARPQRWPAWFRVLLYTAGFVTIAAALLGYIGFARFMSRQIVVTGAILTTMYIGFLSARALAAENAFADTALGRRTQARLGLQDTTLDQLALVASVVVNILVLVWGVPLILFQWGFKWGDIRTWLYNVATEVHIGSVSISLLGVLTGILVFVIGFLVTRWFQRWLDRSVLARGRVDSGVRNSINTSIGYAGIALALLIGISAAGVDLSSLALVAGALSLGIGFGLQNIVSNFVSGLILLAERPFKAGDWIVAGNVAGFVKKISVRATEIETFQRQTVILPNSELINAAVGNWTHKNSLGRIEIPVSAAYGSDPRKVHDILLGIAASHPLVMKNPEPFVLFSGFGESSLDFEIRIYLADILMQLVVMNDIRFAIIEQFAKENIEIPFPQRDVHMRTKSFEHAADQVHPNVLRARQYQKEHEGEVEAKPTEDERGA